MAELLFSVLKLVYLIPASNFLGCWISKAGKIYKISFTPLILMYSLAILISFNPFEIANPELLGSIFAVLAIPIGVFIYIPAISVTVFGESNFSFRDLYYVFIVSPLLKFYNNDGLEIGVYRWNNRIAIMDVPSGISNKVVACSNIKEFIGEYYRPNDKVLDISHLYSMEPDFAKEYVRSRAANIWIELGYHKMVKYFHANDDYSYKK